MKLQHLFAVFPGLPEEKMSTLEVTGLFQDARQVIPGSVFVAVKGQKFDGHDFISIAIDRGARALVVEARAKIPDQFAGFILQVPDSRQALDILANRFYWEPGQELFCAGVTGTNGKTSTTYLIESVLNQGGHRTAVMGTINHHLGTQVFPSDMTTPDPISLQKRLREFRNLGATAVALEVSSHALDQKRADSVPWNAAVFTNLTRDHLDYHGDMQSYFSAKQRFFVDLLEQSNKFPRFAVVNIDSSWGRSLRISGSADLLTYGQGEADLQFEILDLNFSSTRFILTTPWSKNEISLPFCGAHNVQNAVAAIGVGVAAGVKWKLILEGIEKFNGVPGRLQSVPNQKSRHVFVDYAHSPDALINVLGSLGEIRKKRKEKNRIFVIFGCGGDRDRGKRPLMATAAILGADYVYVTSDNPRTENPDSIIAEILTGIPSSERSRVRVVADRFQAIAQCLVESSENDVVLIAGKGHEEYQVIGDERKPFSDFDTAKNILEELK